MFSQETAQIFVKCKQRNNINTINTGITSVYHYRDIYSYISITRNLLEDKVGSVIS